jgi:hypothetical protein
MKPKIIDKLREILSLILRSQSKNTVGSKKIYSAFKKEEIMELDGIIDNL